MCRGAMAISYRIKYLSQILEQLHGKNDVYPLLHGLFQSMCDYLGYGHCFLYQRNHQKSFSLIESYAVAAGFSAEPEIDFYSIFGEEDMRRFSHMRSVSFCNNEFDSTLEEKLAEQFSARSMVAVPVINHAGELVCVVALADRRKVSRTMSDDMTFAYCILSTLADYIKNQLYLEIIERTTSVLQSVTNEMGAAIYVTDFYTHEVLYANASMAAPYGTVEDMVGKTCWQYLHEGSTGECDFCPKKKLIDENGNPTKHYAYDYQRSRDGLWFRGLSSALRWIDGRLAIIISNIDITEEKKSQAIIEHLASHDKITNLPNRNKLTATSDAELQKILESGQTGYLIFFDLDGFKAVNDKNGHIRGDDLLVQIGRLLQENPLTRDRCYRYGGDEFIILVDPNSPEAIRPTLDLIRKMFSSPFNVGGLEVSCGASVGVSCVPLDDTTTAGLIRKADQAMYASKNNGKNQATFYNGGNFCSEEEYFESAV